VSYEAHDLVYCAGDCNAGPKRIALTMPGLAQVQRAKGSRVLLLANVLRAKFDTSLMPIAAMLIAEEQRRKVTFDAYLTNVALHEMASHLGVEDDLHGLKDEAVERSAPLIASARASLVTLQMARLLSENPEEHYATYLAGIFRAMRFGASSPSGAASLVLFNHLGQAGAIVRDDASGTYRVDGERMPEAVDDLARRLTPAPDELGSKEFASFVRGLLQVDGKLLADVDRLIQSAVPIDLVFEQPGVTS
jgi:hypothetical protein